MNWLREPETEPLPGYILVEPLGTGGFGEVWKCVAPGGIHKAIKFVYGNLNSLDDDSAKAEQEFKAMERVKAVRHPFVLSMERIDVVGGELLIVMELADKSLHDVMQECLAAGLPGVPRDALVSYLSDAAEGLDHLIEKHNLLHLDVKPKNLFLIGERVKVADFGLVKHLERQSSGGLMGGITPIYAAPETFANKISKQSDQYSLAVLFVELLTGRRPFNGKNIRQLAMQHMAEQPDLSMLDEVDRAAVARALSKSPDDRFPSCGAFIRAVGGRETKPGSGTIVLTPRPRDTDTPSARQASPPTPRVPVPVPPALLDRLAARTGPNQSVSLSVSFRPEEGVLRPAILIGVGRFGRRALGQIRCRLLDRVGALSQVPCLRFITLDSDPDPTLRPATGLSDAALTPDHAFQAPLQPAANYRRRQLDQILEWLPREKLYSIPRSLRVDGSRALGRLAFTDHYLRFVTRLRNEIQVATHPEAVSQSADHSGLPVKTSVPAVYIFASASGGSGGGLLDIGHAVRRTLERFHVADAPVTAFVFAGAPEDSTTPAAELANTFAALTELHHFADPDVTFAAQYGGPDGPKVNARGLPFTATYLLPMQARTPEAFRDCVSHLAGYVTHDLTTPLGTGLEKIRRQRVPAGRTPFRGFGTFGVWYPRGLLIRSAASQACAQVLRTWADANRIDPPPAATTTLNGILADTRLTPPEVQAYIARESASGPDGNPTEAVRVWRSELLAADTDARRTDPAGWADHAWDSARDLLGLEPTTEADSPFRRGRVSRSLDLGLRRAVEAWQNELTELLRPLAELSGPRLTVTANVVRQIAAACASAASAMERQEQAHTLSRGQARAEVQAAVSACRGHSDGRPFALLPGRTGRLIRAAADKLRTFAELRLKEDLTVAAAQFYRRLQNHFEDWHRDLLAARERVVDLAERLEAATVLPATGQSGVITRGDQALEDTDNAVQATLQESNTMRVVLPHGEDHLDRSAAELLAGVPAEELARLELLLTRLVVEPRGGLVGACRGSADLATVLAGPMVEQATAFLAALVPGEDVTAVEVSAAGGDLHDLTRRVAGYVRAAAPLAHGPAAEEKTFVMLPDTDAGRQYAEAVRAGVPDATAVTVRNTDTDLLFCREQACLRPADLHRLLEPCWEAYQEFTATTDHNPHSRFDVPTWMPLVD